MTKREKRLQDLRRKINRMERDRELGIKLLVKAVTMLPGLRKEEARLVSTLLRAPAPRARVAEHPVPRPSEHVAQNGGTPDDTPAPVKNDASAKPLGRDADDDDIPSFLERGMRAQTAVNEIMAEQEADRKRKAKRRIEKLKISQEVKHAELTGQRRRMPLTGRAALDALK